MVCLTQRSCLDLGRAAWRHIRSKPTRTFVAESHWEHQACPASQVRLCGSGRKGRVFSLILVGAFPFQDILSDGSIYYTAQVCRAVCDPSAFSFLTGSPACEAPSASKKNKKRKSTTQDRKIDGSRGIELFTYIFTTSSPHKQPVRLGGRTSRGVKVVPSGPQVPLFRNRPRTAEPVTLKSCRLASDLLTLWAHRPLTTEPKRFLILLRIFPQLLRAPAEKNGSPSSNSSSNKNNSRNSRSKKGGPWH